MHYCNPTFRKSQRKTHQIKGNCMFYIHAGFTRAFHAETIFTYDKELDDRPSDQTKQMRDKMQSPSRCFVCWLWDFPHSHIMSEDKNISLEIFQHDFLIQRESLGDLHMLIFELLFSYIYIYSASIGLGDNVLSNTLWLTGLSYSRYVFFFCSSSVNTW